MIFNSQISFMSSPSFFLFFSFSLQIRGKTTVVCVAICGTAIRHRNNFLNRERLYIAIPPQHRRYSTTVHCLYIAPPFALFSWFHLTSDMCDRKLISTFFSLFLRLNYINGHRTLLNGKNNEIKALKFLQKCWFNF